MFGIDLFDASLIPALMVALLAGALSFLSPCVLPIVPPYLAYMSGISVGEMRQGKAPIVAALFFVLGLSTVFLLLGAAASAFGALLLSYSDALSTVAGVVVMIFGAHFLRIFRIPLFDREFRVETGAANGGALGAYVLGLAFAFGWTPCIGPQLGTILTLAAKEASVARGAVLLASYALGLGLPFLAVALFMGRMMPVMAFFKTHMERIERISGLLLWTVGLLMLTGGFSALAYWLQENFPFLAKIG